MTPFACCRVLATTAMLVCIATSAAATTLVIQPSSQDAYVTQQQPNHVFGSSPTTTRMFVQSSTPNPRVERGLVQFDLSGIPQFSTVTSAVLQINQQSAPLGNSRTHGVHKIGAAWLQSTVKWNTQPGANLSPTSTAIVGDSKGFKSFTVTPDVQAFVNNPTTNFGWLVRDQAENVGNQEVGYVTREESHIPDIPKEPILTVDYTAPPCSTNAECQDSNPCTTNERCQAGHCAVDPVNCDDGNACTDDICDPQQGCLHPIGECNDGFSCTIDTCDPQGGCIHTAVDAVCLHNGCQTGTCIADQNDNTLDPVTGCHVTSVAPDGTGCNDQNGCTQTDTCSSGECVGANPVTCTPLDACHVAGTCNSGTGTCSNPPAGSGTSCNDSNACTQTDQCDGSGNCVGSNPVACTALDQCHGVGVCNTGTGICSNPNKADGSTCSDGNACTQTDQCTGGSCVGGNPVVCTPLDQCHNAGTCNTGTGICSNPNKADGSTCSDGNACTQTDQCTGGSCVGSNPVTCSALDQCHDVGTCNTGTGVCSNPNKPDGTGCNDSDACTQTDQCTGGSCVGGNPVICAALDQCHQIGSCNPGNGVCSNPNQPDGTACTDSNACTVGDQCTGGSCTSGTPVTCTPLDQCHDAGTCDTGTGQCSNPPSAGGTGCNDGDLCTHTDQCDGSGNCAGTPVVCTPLDDCHVAGTCDSGTGDCSNPAADNGTTCNDGNACTLGDTCSGGTCIGDPMTCGNGTVEPSCGEDCDDQTPGANCTAQCRFICGPTPQANCRVPAKPGKAVLILKNKTPDKRDVLLWKWAKGAATTLSELGTPLTTTGYTLCVYDSSANPQPLLLSMAPPAGTCAGKPCWKSIKGGFKYKDKDLTPDGLSFLLEKAGAALAAKIIVKGKGPNLAVPTLPLTPTVTVQLKKNDDPGICWQATYSTTIKNLPEQFKAKAN